MNRMIVIAATLLALLSPIAARGALKEGTVAPDVDGKNWVNSDKPVSLSELRGLVVVLYFWVSFHETGEKVLPYMTTVDGNERFGRQAGVYVMGVTEADARRTEDGIRKAKAFFPVVVESKSYREYEIEQFPQAVIIDPNGKVAWTGWPGDVDQMLKSVQDVMQKTPPTRTHPREATRTTEYIEQTRKNLADGKLREAHATALKANEHALSGDPLKARCQEYLDLLESLARDTLANGERELISNNFNEAVAFFRQVSDDFRGLESARRARIRLMAISKERPEVKTILDEQGRDAEALKKIAQARDHIESQSFHEAYTLCEEALNAAPKSEAGQYAQTLISRMQKHPAVMKLVRDGKAMRDCEPLLLQAKADVRQKRFASAKPKLERIVRDHPETSFADEARKLLIEIP